MVFETRVVPTGVFIDKIQVQATIFSSTGCDGACLMKQEVTKCMAYHFDKDERRCLCGELDYYPLNTSQYKIVTAVNPTCPHPPGTEI